MAALCGAGLLSGCNSMGTTAQAQSAMRMDPAGMEAMLASWPEASRMAAMDMMRKYGSPQGVTASMLIWENNGPWKWTRIFREPVQHNFPMPHPDVLEQAINYQVPVDRYDDLARYDGSVIAERTKGQLSARCDKEGANFLAINLANDVATGRRTVEDARAYYARAMQAFKQTNRMDPYMQRLQFQPPARAGEPDRAVI
jgi:hypothetical protein